MGTILGSAMKGMPPSDRSTTSSITVVDEGKETVATPEQISTGNPDAKSIVKKPIKASLSRMALSQEERQKIMREEATLRGIDEDLAVRIFSGEGLAQDSYQSRIPRDGSGSLGGFEASFGDTQLYIKGLGADYQKETGRNLVDENTPEGLRRMIQWSLDEIITSKKGWSSWSAAKKMKIKPKQGLDNAKPVYNWKED